MLRKNRTALVALAAAAGSAGATIALMPAGGPQTEDAGAAAKRAGREAPAAGDRRPPGPPVLGLAMAALRPKDLQPPAQPPAGGPPSRADRFAAITRGLDGKSTDHVAAAWRAAIVKRLDAAVSEGKLASAKRDDLLAAWDADRRPGPPPGAAGLPPGAAGPPPAAPGPGACERPPEAAAAIEAFRADVADALGVSADDLNKAVDAA